MNNKFKTISKAALLLFAMAALASALENGLARLPPMGWNGWNTFRCEGITETLFTETAIAMKDRGLQAAGYEYLNIDDCWSAGRTTTGYLKASADFTDQSLETLSTLVHDLGFKFGIYGSAGTGTCESYAGSWDFEEKDAERYAQWGVDYIKQDFCWTTDENWWQWATQDVGIYRYTKMRDAILATGRPMVYSICSWGRIDSWTWADTVGHVWRTTNDIENGFLHISNIIKQQEDLWPYSKPGAWNDPDMMMVGKGLMDKEEDQVHFGMWCMLAAPLIMGNDLRTMNNQTLQILINAEAIAVDQDSLGIQARVLKEVAAGDDNNGPAQVWVRPLVNGRAIALYNATGSAQTMSFELSELNTPEWTEKGLTWDPGMTGNLREIWGAQDLGVYSGGTIEMSVPSHSMKFITLRSDEIDWSAKIPRDPTSIISKNRFLSAGGIKISYMPNKSAVTINLPLESYKYSVVDSRGKVISTGDSKTNSHTISTERYLKGIYYINVHKDGSTFSKPFAIYH